jgi:hypothetical protein
MGMLERIRNVLFLLVKVEALRGEKEIELYNAKKQSKQSFP